MCLFIALEITCSWHDWVQLEFNLKGPLSQIITFVFSHSHLWISEICIWMFQCPHKYRGGEWRFYTGCCSEYWEMLFLTTAALTRINPCCSEYYTDSKVCPLELSRERSGNKHPIFPAQGLLPWSIWPNLTRQSFSTMLGLHVRSFYCIGRHQCNLISLNRERKAVMGVLK